MGNNNDYDYSNDPARIKHVSYSAGISAGSEFLSGYIEGSVEKGDKGNLEPSLNTGVNASISTPTPIYYEQGANKEISIGSGGFEKSTNYYKSQGCSYGIKNILSAYAEKTTYVNKEDVDKYNARVEEYRELKEHPIYKSNRAIREEINHDYHDCIHPYDYNKEFNIPKETKKKENN